MNLKSKFGKSPSWYYQATKSSKVSKSVAKSRGFLQVLFDRNLNPD